jgi:hypothetical protein
MDASNVTRRTFKKGSFLMLLLVFSLSAFSGNPTGTSIDNNVKLNPDCKVKRLSNGSVIVTARNEEGVDVKHEFTDFYADLVMAYYRKQKINYILDSFSKKYYLSEDECRREIKHALNVLAEWNIVLRDDGLASVNSL